MKKQLYAKNPNLAIADAADTQLLAPVLQKFVDNLEFVKPISGQDYFTEAEKAMFYSALYNELRANIKDGATGPQGYAGVAGPQGPRGFDGKTPTRGVDYFTPSDVSMIVEKVLALVPPPIEPKMPDIATAIAPHMEAFQKNLPTNDSILVSILKDKRLRMLLHGGGTVGGATVGVATVETPTGTVDGSNATFTVANTPLYIIVDGVSKFATLHYTYLAGTITIIDGAPPALFIRSLYTTT